MPKPMNGNIAQAQTISKSFWASLFWVKKIDYIASWLVMIKKNVFTFSIVIYLLITILLLIYLILIGFQKNKLVNIS